MVLELNLSLRALKKKEDGKSFLDLPAQLSGKLAAFRFDHRALLSQGADGFTTNSTGCRAFSEQVRREPVCSVRVSAQAVKC